MAEVRNEVINEDRKEYIEREARYIDANKFIDWLDIGHLRSPSEKCLSELNVKKMIELQPTADVAEVVRCKDCKHKTQLMGKAPFAFYACSHNKGLGDNVRLDDFCSYGERKDK